MSKKFCLVFLAFAFCFITQVVYAGEDDILIKKRKLIVEELSCDSQTLFVYPIPYKNPRYMSSKEGTRTYKVRIENNGNHVLTYTLRIEGKIVIDTIRSGEIKPKKSKETQFEYTSNYPNSIAIDINRLKDNLECTTPEIASCTITLYKVRQSLC